MLQLVNVLDAQRFFPADFAVQNAISISRNSRIWPSTCLPGRVKAVVAQPTVPKVAAIFTGFYQNNAFLLLRIC